MTDAISQVGFLVSGRVQGVGFRWWTQKKGNELGVGGTVKNLADGSVEVHAAGTVNEVEALRELLLKGPWAAKVRSVREIASSETLPSAFEVLL